MASASTCIPTDWILLDDGTISGSSKYVLYGMENLIEKLGLAPHLVSRMASLNPARLLGIEAAEGFRSLWGKTRISS